MKPAQQLTILVCDDTEATRYSVCRTLRHEGFHCLEAANGMGALKVLEENKVDLVVLDIHLPDILGFEVCRRIKANPKTAFIPVLQISASYVTSKDKIHGLEGGADSYLTHPVEPPVLIATVKSLLRFRTLNDDLKSNEERLKMALEIAKLGTWDYFEGKDDLVLSARAREILGVPDQEGFTFKKLMQKIAHSDRFAFLRELARLNQVGSELETEIRILGNAKQVKWIRVRGRKTSSPENSICLTGTLLDITEPKIAREELEKSRDIAEHLREAAESANQAKSQFLANMSHEIRTPLGAILGYTDLLTEGAETPQEQAQFLSALKRNAQLLTKLIESVLDLSKVEADKMALEVVKVPFQEILQDLVSVLGLRARERGIDLILEIKNRIPATIQTDPTRLKQILINLVGNAIKFSDKGQILIEVEMRSSPIVGEDVDLEIRVTDHGIGISPEQQKKLFQPFMQADNSMSRRFGGTGLGLMLSRKLAHLLGGDLVLSQSEPGVGSQFTLTIKGGPYSGVAMEPRTGAVAQTLTNTPPQLSNLKVLLVEDSEDNQFMFNRFLSSLGIAVEIAENGKQGIEKALQQEFDLILMDIQMPLMDGYQATRELRRQGFKKPIVALTAHSVKGEKENCIACGFDEYMTKPIDRDLLTNLLHRLGQ